MFSHVQLCDSMDWSLPGSSVHGILLAGKTEMGHNFFLQGIFLTQGSNHCLLHLSPALADIFFFSPLAPPEKPIYLLVVSKLIQNNCVQLLHQFLSLN